ncbi:Hypothetical protein POVR2_LOCUS66 [uncultured virus]|nr:Hypothetical protein POVR2_LOCUS66 [uncultured virus]
MFEPLLAILATVADAGDTYEFGLLLATIQRGQVSMTGCLLEICESLTEIDEPDLLLSCAMKSGSVEMLEYVLDKYTYCIEDAMDSLFSLNSNYLAMATVIVSRFKPTTLQLKIVVKEASQERGYGASDVVNSTSVLA